MLSTQWMNESSPGDDYAPRRSRPLVAGRTPRQGRRIFIEENSLEARRLFVRLRPQKTTSAALKKIERGLTEAIQASDLQPGSRGGRKPLEYRHFLIVNLAEIWATALGRRVSGAPGSDFVGFCESVAVSLGWPSDGFSSAVPGAVRYR